jgi:putative nucleotidyltransferase with HDIG domain
MPNDNHAILLVDDEAPTLRALERLFRGKDYTILSAQGGEEALAILRQTAEPVSLIISDHRMPGMNGAQFLERSRDIAIDAVRFLLTGYADLDAVVASVNQGKIQRYLTKPWDDRDLLRQAHWAIEQVELKRKDRRLLVLLRFLNEELQKVYQQLEDKVAARTAEINAKNKELEENLYNTVRALTALLNVNTPHLAEHSRRVSQIARQIAISLELPQADVDDVEVAALLHDVAKIGYPRKLLDNRTNLWHSEDTERYRQHPVEGQQTIQFISRLGRVGDFIRAHHERYDGQGFPDGLAEGAIPLGGRIIAVANAYDRIVHLADNAQRRVKEYLLGVKGQTGRPADELRREAALFYLKQQAFTQFDPDIVKCFLRLAEGGAPALEAVREISLSELRPGMRLARDLHSTTGSFLFCHGTVISAAHIVKLKFIRAKKLCTDTLCVAPQDSSVLKRKAS